MPEIPGTFYDVLVEDDNGNMVPDSFLGTLVLEVEHDTAVDMGAWNSAVGGYLSGGTEQHPMRKYETRISSFTNREFEGVVIDDPDNPARMVGRHVQGIIQTNTTELIDMANAGELPRGEQFRSP